MDIKQLLNRLSQKGIKQDILSIILQKGQLWGSAKIRQDELRLSMRQSKKHLTKFEEVVSFDNVEYSFDEGDAKSVWLFPF